MKVIKFQQLGTTGSSMILSVGRTGKLLYNDPKEGNRPIRHCRNEKSPFIDEQSEHAVVVPLVFSFGMLEVDESERVTLRFLNLHPGNEKNGGKLFREVDSEKEAKDGLFLEDLVVALKAQALDAETKEKNKGALKLLALASVIKGSYSLVKDLSKPELRRIINKDIGERPMAYLNEAGEPELFNEETVRNFMAIRAIDEEVVKVAPGGRRLTWPNGDVIFEVPAGRKIKEYFAEYLASEEGMLIAKDLEKRLA